MTKVTRVPNTPSYILGIIHFAQEVMPVIDSRILFNLEQSEHTKQTSILVLDIHINGKTLAVGFVVDSVHEVIEINEEKILPAPSVEGFEQTSGFLKGIVYHKEECILLIDFNEMFNAGSLKNIKADFARITKLAEQEK